MGCVRQRTAGSWQILYYHDGKQKSKTVRATKRDAERILREIERAIDLGEYESEAKKVALVGDVLRDWLEDVKGRREAATYQTYESAVRLWLMPEFGGFELSALGPSEIRSIYRMWSGRGVSLAAKHQALSAALGWAVKMELVDRNAAVPVSPGREPALSPRGTLDDAQVQLLLCEARRHQYGGQAILALSTGMRRGEICGLRWCNVHIDRRMLEIRDSVVRLNGGVMVQKGPKTRSSIRRLSLPGIALDVLDDQPRDGEYVFGGHQHICPSALSAGVKRLCQGLGLNTTLHGLRHTHASLLNRLGGNPKAVQERLGHSSLQETMQTYTHLLPSQHTELVALLDDAMGGMMTQQ